MRRVPCVSSQTKRPAGLRTPGRELRAAAAKKVSRSASLGGFGQVAAQEFQDCAIPSREERSILARVRAPGLARFAGKLVFDLSVGEILVSLGGDRWT
jgi:hypothetical protein